MMRADGLHIDCTTDHRRIPTLRAARLVDLYNSSYCDRMLVLKSEVSAGFIKPLLRGHKVAHMRTSSTEALRAKSLIRAVVETPLALVIVAVSDVPTLIVRDTATKGVHSRTAYNLASGQVDSPVSLSMHGVYLVSMYSAVGASPSPL